MSENRRNRRYSNYKEKSKQVDPPIQPKILIKVREKNPPVNPRISIQSNVTITQREHEGVPSTSTHSASNTASGTPLSESHQVPNVAQMTKPITILSLANNQVNSNTSKLLMKANTDFLVVGIIGRQGIGKSTIMNFLASERCGVDFALNDDTISRNAEEIYKKYFIKHEGVFPTKFKPGKGPSTPRTESLHMFITKDRFILLDGPPILTNPGKKDATTNEVEDINLIILLLTVCHLLIVVQDEFFDLNLFRLLQFAELCKPTESDSKSFANYHLPNILFLKNHANDNDYLKESKLKFENMIKYCFKNSDLKIFFGQSDQYCETRSTTVNYFLFPEITEENLFTSNLDMLMDDLRHRVFVTPKSPLLHTACNEALWFEIFSNSCMSRNEFYLTKYEEVRRTHTNSFSDQGTV